MSRSAALGIGMSSPVKPLRYQWNSDSDEDDEPRTPTPRPVTSSYPPWKKPVVSVIVPVPFCAAIFVVVKYPRAFIHAQHARARAAIRGLRAVLRCQVPTLAATAQPCHARRVRSAIAQRVLLGTCMCGRACACHAAPRHAATPPRRATPRHAAPRRATPRHAAPACTCTHAHAAGFVVQCSATVSDGSQGTRCRPSG